MKNTRCMVTIAMLIAADIVLTRVLMFMPLPTLRFTFEFIAIALIGIRFGPWVAAVSAAAADVIGFFLLNTTGQAFFPGFTISAAVSGLVYGLMLYKRRPNWVRVLLAALLVVFVVEAGLNTFWLSITFGKAFFVLLPMRLIKAGIMLVVQTGLITAVWTLLAKALPEFRKIT